MYHLKSLRNDLMKYKEKLVRITVGTSYFTGYIQDAKIESGSDVLLKVDGVDSSSPIRKRGYMRALEETEVKTRVFHLLNDGCVCTILK